MANGKKNAQAESMSAAIRKQQEIVEAMRRKLEAEKKKKGGK